MYSLHQEPLSADDRRSLSGRQSAARSPSLAFPIALLFAGSLVLWSSFHLGRDPRGNAWGLATAGTLIAGVAAIVAAVVIALPRLTDRRDLRAARRERAAALARGIAEVIRLDADAAWLISFPELDFDQILYRAEPDGFVLIDLPSPPPDPSLPVPASLILRRTPGPGAELIDGPIAPDSQAIALRPDLRHVESSALDDAPIPCIPGELVPLSRLPTSWHPVLRA